MPETPWGRYLRRQTEIEVLKMELFSKAQEIKEELTAAQKECSHVDGSAFFLDGCVKCGKDLA